MVKWKIVSASLRIRVSLYDCRSSDLQKH